MEKHILGGNPVKKISIVLFSVTCIVVVALSAPQFGTSNPLVDESPSGCIPCHEVGTFGAQDGSIHGSHSNDCIDCHEGTPGRGNVSSSACIDCHPFGDPGKCPLVDFHEESLSYDPSGLSCLDCHADCDEGNGSTTTTTTTPGVTIRDSRYEVFLVGALEGCTAATMNFRSDNVLLLDCPEGFGVYLSFGGFFTGVYWSNNYYQGYGLLMVLSGVAVDSYITIGGVALYANKISPVIYSGYRKNTP